MIKKQSGMTLVEVIATLVIASLVIILIWTTVAISMKHNIVETKKLHWQQEANRIITEIQHFHRKCETYNLSATHQKIQIEHCMINGVDQGTEQIAYDFYYEVYVNGEIIELYYIDTNGISASYDLTLIVREPAKADPKVAIDSKISRYQHN